MDKKCEYCRAYLEEIKYDNIYRNFVCPYKDKKWHINIISISEEMQKTSSPSLKKIFRKDVEDIIFRELEIHSNRKNQKK